MIEPKMPKGFRDSLPVQEIRRQRLEAKLKGVFESYGFVPIDTPVIEYTEVLLGKGGGETDKQIFHFTDNGGREVALRFDLTVPLARFASAHQAELHFPFKRYHIAKVFRGEKPQKGRYREFVQCDFDIVGDDSAASDFEIISMMAASLKALDAGPFKIHVSHRGLLNDFLARHRIRDRNADILKAIDKLPKTGMDEVRSELAANGLDDGQIEALIAYISPDDLLDSSDSSDSPDSSGSSDGTLKGDAGAPEFNALESGALEFNAQEFKKRLDRLESQLGGETASSMRMKEIFQLIDVCGLGDCVVFDPSITRGLDYYTGVVFETFLERDVAIGSVCSGGRYNNLTGLYSAKALPGVGACVGIDRLMAAMEESDQAQMPGSVDVVFFSKCLENLAQTQRMAAALRQAGLRCDVYLGQGKAKEQYDYASEKGASYAVLSVSDGMAQVKNLCTRKITEGLDAQAVAAMVKARC